MSASSKKKRAQTRRAVRPAEIANKGVTWTHFERITSNKMRLKPEVSRTYYALAHLFADEFDAQRITLRASGPEATTDAFGQSLFLRHAASTLRMLAERLLKSFRLSEVIDAERYSLEPWTIAVRRLNRKGELPLPPVSSDQTPAN